LPLEEVALGRGEDCQVVLDDEPVSRVHAKVVYQDYKPELLDLGSKNGTFINGKRVHRAQLKQGDQIQVGASVFEVLIGKENWDSGSDTERPADKKHLQSLRGKMKGAAPSPNGQCSALSGRLSEINMTSLLQILDSDQATGTLVILQGGQEGRLHVHRGEVRHATFGRALGVKALYRLMSLQDGVFEFFVPGRSPEYHTIEGDLHRHILEAVRQMDEFAVYRKQLPLPETHLVFNPNMLIAPGKVPAEAFELMTAIRQHNSVEEIIEACRIPDVEACRILLVLLKHRIVLVEAQETQQGVKPRLVRDSAKIPLTSECS
jgi:hypothetical protein